MKYCTYCGRPMRDGDRYCRKCGRAVHYRQSKPLPSAGMQEAVYLLCCELAYTGTLFWLPLLVCPKSKSARYHANQGLWLLVLSAAGCTGIRLLGEANAFLAGTLPGTVFHGIYALAFIVFLAGMFFLLWSALNGALAVHRRSSPGSILFFDRTAIIR